jgi:hypothetical protein
LKWNWIIEFHIKVPFTNPESPSLFSSTLYTYYNPVCNQTHRWKHLSGVMPMVNLLCFADSVAAVGGAVVVVTPVWSLPGPFFLRGL